MLEFLLLEKVGSGILYNMVSGIYAFVARMYDVMLKLSGRGDDVGSIQQFYLGDIATAMYTIAGVFMLFRVTIAAINMIINPDMVNDSNKGAGKILVRIVTSLAMLILFVPTGWIFGEDGILIRIESAIIQQGGLIDNISKSIDPFAESTESVSGPNQNDANLLNATDVYAAGDTVNCYYFYKLRTNTVRSQGEVQNVDVTSKIKYSADKGVYHIRFYNKPVSNTDPSNGPAKLCTKWNNSLFGSGSRAQDCDKFSFEIIKDDPKVYKDLPSNPSYGGLLIGSHFASGWKTTCPHIISGGTVYFEAKTGKVGSYKTESYGIVGGWHSHDAMAKVLQLEAIVTGNEAETAKEVFNVPTAAEDFDERMNGDRVSLNVENDEAIDFAQASMGTFISCADPVTCESLRATILINSSADDQVVDGMADGSISLDFFPALIAGIGILVWIVVLCVDVIVRRFKLLLLQMIAPIPIISYSDPNDKMFDQWGKMYIGTYVDLFLKLIAISFATILLHILWSIASLGDNAIEKFFYIVAILVFAKMIPSMISKIFGIDSLGGSFKDITNMGKAALGFGAGAAVGAIGGGITGMTAGTLGRKGLAKVGGGAFGAVKGAVGGALLGAGSGSKGNVTGGAKAQSAANYRAAAARMNGLSTMDLLMGRAESAIGYSPKARIEDQIKGKEFLKSNVNDIQNAVSDVEKSLEGTNVMKDLRNAFDRGEIDMDAYKSGMLQLASIWDKGGQTVAVARRDQNGNILRDAAGKEITDNYYKDNIKIMKKDGSMYGGSQGLAVKEEAGFKKGYDSAVSRFETTVATIKSNSDTVKTLTSSEYGLNLDPVDETGAALEGMDRVQKVKGTTFGADSKLQEEITELKSGAKMQKAQAIDSYNSSGK